MHFFIEDARSVSASPVGTWKCALAIEYMFASLR
jgi:hypothetical protein